MSIETTAFRIPSIHDQIAPKLLNRLLMGAIVVVMLIHLLTLTIYPAAFIDEGWLANASWTWLTTGVNFDAIHTGTLDQLENPWAWRYFLGQAPYVATFAVFGLGLFQARLATWIFGIILLFGTVRVGHRLFGMTTGLLAALLLALSLPFLYSTRWRQDIILAAVIMLAFWLTLVAMHENRLWMHFAAGLMLTLGLDIHQMVVMFIPAWAVLHLVYYGRRIFLERGTWLVGLGGVLGVVIYAATHILPAPETYSTMLSFVAGPGSHVQMPISNPESLPMSLFQEWGRYFDRRYPLDFALVAAGSLFLLIRRSKSDRLLGAFIVAVIVTFVLFSSLKTDAYAIFLYPFLLMVVAETFAFLLFRTSLKGHFRTIIYMTLIVILVAQVARLVERVHTNKDYDYDPVISQMRAVISPDARILGMPTWWFGFADADYRSSLNLSKYRFFFGYDIAAAFEMMQPEYVIVDDFKRYLLVDMEDLPLPYGMDMYAMPRQEFWGVMEQYGRLVLEFDNRWHGLIQIYEMEW